MEEVGSIKSFLTSSAGTVVSPVTLSIETFIPLGHLVLADSSVLSHSLLIKTAALKYRARLKSASLDAFFTCRGMKKSYRRGLPTFSLPEDVLNLKISLMGLRIFLPHPGSQ
jgi:hypothetical protein